MIKLVSDKIESSRTSLDDAKRFIEEMESIGLVDVIMIQVGIRNGEFHRYKDIKEGSNLLEAIGALEVAKQDFINNIVHVQGD